MTESAAETENVHVAVEGFGQFTDTHLDLFINCN